MNSIGDHIRKKRLERGLYQKDVAAVLGVDAVTVINWENRHSSPRLQVLPKIVAFLGYLPMLASDDTLGARILAKRWSLGMTQEALARQLGVDPTTLARWENNQGKSSASHQEQLTGFLSFGVRWVN